MPTHVLAHSIDLIGWSQRGADPPPAPPGVGVRAIEGGVQVALLTADFGPLRELQTSALARALLSAATAPVATRVSVEAELVFLDERIARRFYEIVRAGYPRGDFEPRAGDRAWPAARYDVRYEGWRGAVLLRGSGPQAFRAAVQLERPAEPAPAAAAALEALERVALGWTRELRAHGYNP